jgi:hypothetical protein
VTKTIFMCGNSLEKMNTLEQADAMRRGAPPRGALSPLARNFNVIHVKKRTRRLIGAIIQALG